MNLIIVELQNQQRERLMLHVDVVDLDEVTTRVEGKSDEEKVAPTYAAKN
jgi:hypothetical protein